MAKQLKHLRTAREVVKALGGNIAVQAMTERCQSAVPNWKKKNRFPSNTYTTLMPELEARGYSAPNALFGMP
jgi:hypothetical protein